MKRLTVSTVLTRTRSRKNIAVFSAAKLRQGLFQQNRRNASHFAAKGLVKADIELQPLSAIDEIIERFKNDDVPSRVVLDLIGDIAENVVTPLRKDVLRPVPVHA